MTAALIGRAPIRATRTAINHRLRLSILVPKPPGPARDVPV
jgi:hypothetical protein